MQTSFDPVGPVVVATLTGVLDQPEVTAFEERFRRALASCGGRMVVRLGGVSPVTSALLGVFVRVRKASEAAGGEIALAEPTPVCRHVIATMGLDRVFRVFDSVDAAIRHVTPAAPPR